MLSKYTVWAYATASHASPESVGVIAESIDGSLEGFELSQVAGIEWAVSAAGGQASPVLCEVIAEVAKGRVENFNPKACAYTL